MRTAFLFFSAHLLAVSLGLITAVDEPKEVSKIDIEFPVGPILPKPPILPPTDVIRLKGDVEYVFDSNTPVVVVPSPEGVISVVEESGPIKIRGRFFDGGNLSESRQFKRKQVFVVTGVVEANGKVAELLIFPTGARLKSEVIRKKFQVGDLKIIPTPDPKIDPKVDPDTPAPIPHQGLRVLVVFESADLMKMPPKQQLIMYSRRVWDHLDSVCVAGADGKKEWRIWEQNVPGLENETKLWQEAMKRDRKSTPWVIISNGKTGTEEALPATIEEFLALVNKYKQ